MSCIVTCKGCSEVWSIWLELVVFTVTLRIYLFCKNGSPAQLRMRNKVGACNLFRESGMNLYLVSFVGLKRERDDIKEGPAHMPTKRHPFSLCLLHVHHGIGWAFWGSFFAATAAANFGWEKRETVLYFWYLRKLLSFLPRHQHPLPTFISCLLLQIPKKNILLLV